MFNNIVFSGGGALGVVYPGSIQALKDSGIMRNDQILCGTSAGAITASLTALNITPNVMHQLLTSKSHKEFLGESTNLLYGYNMRGLRAILISCIKHSLQNVRQTQPIMDNLDGEAENRLKEILDEQFEYSDFRLSDLEILKAAFPKECFNSILITAVHKNTQTIQKFSSYDQTLNIHSWLKNFYKAHKIIKSMYHEDQLDTNFALSKNDFDVLMQVWPMQLSFEINDRDDSNSEISIDQLKDKKSLILCIRNIRKIIGKNIKNNASLLNKLEELDSNLMSPNQCIDGELLNFFYNANQLHQYKSYTIKNQQVILDDAVLVDVILSSAAIPAFMQTQKINGQEYIDGGVLSNIPIQNVDQSLVVTFNNQKYRRVLFLNEEELLHLKSFMMSIVYFLLTLIKALPLKDSFEAHYPIYKNMREMVGQVILNDLGDLRGHDFDKASQNPKASFLRGYCSTMRHLFLYNIHPDIEEIIRLEAIIAQKSQNKILVQSQKSDITEQKQLSYQELYSKIQPLCYKKSSLNAQEAETNPEEVQQFFKLKQQIELDSASQDEQLNAKTAALKNKRECFWVFDFICAAIDNDRVAKGIKKDSQEYQQIMKYLIDDEFNIQYQNFSEGKPSEIVFIESMNFLFKTIDHEKCTQFLLAAVQNPMISNAFIEEQFRKYILLPNNNVVMTHRIQQFIKQYEKTNQCQTSQIIQ